MTENLTRVEATPTGMRLTDWVAREEGFFASEGIDVHVNWAALHHQQAKVGTTADTDYEDIVQLRLGQFFSKSELTSACAWGGICMAGAGMGHIVRDVHGVSPCGIYVRPDSKIKEPKDLADVGIAVGLRAGSHFSALHHLEKHLPLDRINAVNHGGFGARLEALLSGEAEAASLLPPQNYMADQLGMRAVLKGEFTIAWWVTGEISDDKLQPYLKAIGRAEAALDADLERYLPLWKYSIPPEFEDRTWDFSRFGRGERFVNEAFSQDQFDEFLSQAHRWGLDNHMTERDFDKISYALS